MSPTDPPSTHPPTQGTTWGLGGTCVNVGCIPKKLMHTAALLGEALHADAPAYGWVLGSQPITHDWSKLVTAVQDHIASLNFGYRVSLRCVRERGGREGRLMLRLGLGCAARLLWGWCFRALCLDGRGPCSTRHRPPTPHPPPPHFLLSETGVEYKNVLGTFLDAHTVECVDKKGKKSTLTARRVVVAVGGRPKPLAIPGGELAISSDDIFSLASSPGKTLVVGASYVALECAGFLRGIGCDVSVLVRSILLRGFDAQCAELVGAHMEATGVRFLRPATPSSITRTPAGKLLVSWTNADTGAVSSEEFDSVFTATGRNADTGSLGLAAAGVAMDADGKILTRNEQSVSAPSVYAIGDVVAGGLELTPVAIMAGRLLARRLYGGATQGMDYDRVATAVFTPLEFGNCGLSEEQAAARWGAAAVEVYHSKVTPLEWTIVEARPANGCYAKLVIHKADANRVVGFQLLGPNAGEITQGWAAALRLGATYESFSNTVGIHPTLAEEFTGLTVTKSSGESADKAGC